MGAGGVEGDSADDVAALDEREVGGGVRIGGIDQEVKPVEDKGVVGANGSEVFEG
jgi:hypothetical protein